MELAELTKIEMQDVPPKDTSRTVKPADRCVISYNFQQTHSNNYTHNLLIGMFNQPTKKIHKNVSQTNIDPNRHKLVTLVPHPKKVFRQQPSIITKVYDSNASLKKYVNSNSSRRQVSKNRTYYKNAQQSENSDSRLKNHRETDFQKSYEDPTLQNQPYQNNQFRQRFNEAEERRKSPYKSKNKKKVGLIVRNNSIGSEKKEGSSCKESPSNSFRGEKVGISPSSKQNSSHTVQAIQHSPSFEGRASKNNQSLYSNKSSKLDQEAGIKANSLGNIRLYGKHLQNAKRGVADPDFQKVISRANHLRKVTEKINQTCRKSEDNGEIVEKDDTASLNRENLREQVQRQRKIMKEESFEVKKSRKEIQDEQIRQIEQRIRKEQPWEFKKGYFKILNNNPKEFLPFNSPFEPTNINKPKGQTTHPTLAKEKKRLASRQLPPRNEPLSTHKPQETHPQLDGHRQINKQSLYREQPRNNHRSIDNLDSQQKYLLRQKALEKQNQSTINLNKPLLQKGQKNQKQINRQGTSLVAISKYKQEPIDKKYEPHRLTGNSFNMKIQQKSQNNNQAKRQTNPSKEDITENNQIRGFKVPEPKIHKGVSSVRKQTIEHDNNNVRQNIKGERQNSYWANRSSQAASKPQNTNNRTSNLAADGKHNRNLGVKEQKVGKNARKDMNNQINKRNGFENSIHSKGQTDRTVKMNQGQPLSNRSNDSFRKQFTDELSRGKDQRSSSNNKALSPTIPRKANGKNRKFKDWRQAELQMARKDSKELKKVRTSNSNRAKMTTTRNQKSKMSSRRSKQPQEIDLDAEEQDRFGLLAQKNVTSHKRKSHKKNSQTKPPKQSKVSKGGELNQQIEQEAEESSKTSHKNQQSFDSSHSEAEEEQKSLESARQSQKQVIGQSQNNRSKDMTLEKREDQNVLKSPSIHQGSIQVEHRQSSAEKTEVVQDQLEAQPKKEGVEEIQHLIQENGSNISSISDEESQKQIVILEENTKGNNKKDFEQTNYMKASIIPDPIKQNSNLQDLLKATEEVHSNPREMESICNKVEVQLGKELEKLDAKLEIEVSDSGILVKGEQKLQQVNADIEDIGGEEEDMVVALPPAKLQQTYNGEQSVTKHHSPRVAVEIETDYQEQELDKIAEIPETNKEVNRSEEFFQCNIKQTSKMSDTNQTINFTKYQPFDKDPNHYTRAPILSFLYQISTDSSIFTPSTTPHLLLKKVKTALEINDILIDQAVDILLSIDAWIIERVFEPFQDKEGKIGVWLYCYGVWRLFLEDKSSNYRTIFKNAVFRAIAELQEKPQLETVLKLISGVRVMRLKSSKKKVFNELEYSLKKGHVIKAYTAKDSKWKGKIFQVAKVQTTRQKENVLQIRQDNDTYWVKQEKFKEIFEHFLLICTRHSHFWTGRDLQHRSTQKTVLTLTSHAPSHGSLTLFYPSAEPSSLLLYKQLDSKVLKYMGKIQEKPNHNGNLYFQFRLHGAYSLFLETPASCRLAIESSSPLEIGMPQFVLRETLRNAECEYVQLSHSKSRGKEREGLKESTTLERLKQTFIRMVVKK